MDNKRVVIFGGGTFSHSRSHLATAAPAFGGTARRLAKLCEKHIPNMDVDLRLTRMAGGPATNSDGSVLGMVTNEDVLGNVLQIVVDDRTKIVFFNAALVDWNLYIADGEREHGPTAPRPSSHLAKRHNGYIYVAPKVVDQIRKTRKDIFLVAFKQTTNATEDQQYLAGLNLCKEASCNLVLANDVVTRLNMVITPEEARYHVTKDRNEALEGLVQMAKLRSHLTFTQSTVGPAVEIPWSSPEIPDSLRTVVNFCIEENAYKPFRGSTAGHFACKLTDTTFLTSKRKTDFNDLPRIGLVKVETSGPDTVLAYGAKPSVGGQSQRIVFKDHPGYDCIVHFHCPIKPGSQVPVQSQYEFECGSHECGKNTSNGLKQFGNLKAVYLDQHGPNILFSKDINPQEVIDFIQNNFDLSQKTGGFVSVQP